jgi:hypothetical protein
MEGVDILSLTIETTAITEEELRRLVIPALLTIPPLAAAIAAKRLLLGAIRQEPLPVSGSIKRTIIDRRKDEQC